jgi:hypothetical protein
MGRLQTDWRVGAILLAGLASVSTATAATMSEDAASACSGLARSFDAVKIETAALQAPSPLGVSERAPTPAARVVPANPAFCKVLGSIAAIDSKAPPILFEQGKAPDNLEVVEQKVEAPSFAVLRALPLCRWPGWPHYKQGDFKSASSFGCAP